MVLRSLVLCLPNDHDNQYAAILEQRGHVVVRCHTADEAIRLVCSPDAGYSCIVLDALSTDERKRIVGYLARRAEYTMPRYVFFWVTQAEYFGLAAADEFRHETLSVGADTRVILKGDVRTFFSRLQFIELTVASKDQPALTFVHSRQALRWDSADPELYRQWQLRSGCDIFETITDVIMPNGMSLTHLGRLLIDPLRSSDAYWLDRLARSACWHRGFTADDLIRSMTDFDSHPFALRVSHMFPDGLSHAHLKNALKRLRGAFREGGYDAHNVIRFDDGEYYLDPGLLLRVVHIRE